MRRGNVNENMSTSSVRAWPSVWFLRTAGVLLAVILIACSWLVMSTALIAKKQLDDFGQAPSLAMMVLHHAGVWAFVPMFLLFVAALMCFLAPRWTLRSLTAGACLLATGAVMLAAVMTVLVFEFSKLLSDLS